MWIHVRRLDLKPCFIFWKSMRPLRVWINKAVGTVHLPSWTCLLQWKSIFSLWRRALLFQSNAFINPACLYIYIYTYISIYTCVYAKICLHMYVHMHSLKLNCDCSLSQGIVWGNWDRREKGMAKNRQEISSDFASEMAKKHVSLFLKQHCPFLWYFNNAAVHSTFWMNFTISVLHCHAKFSMICLKKRDI